MLFVYLEGETMCFPNVKSLQLKGGLVRIITAPNRKLFKALKSSGSSVKCIHNFETIDKEKRKVLEINLNASEIQMEFNVEPVEEPK